MDIFKIIEEKRDKIGELLESNKSILEKADIEKRDLSEDETKTVDQNNTQFEELRTEIERLERSKEFEDWAKQSSHESRRIEIPEDKAGEGDENRKYQEAFSKYLRGGVNILEAEERTLLMNNMQEVRAQSAGTDSTGGYTVPDDMAKKIIVAMNKLGGVRDARITIIPTSNGQDMPFPTVDDTGNTGELLSENSQAAAQDITFGSKTLNAYMFSSKIVRVSLQLLQDSAFDIGSFIADRLGERIGRVTNTYFTTGTGSSQPEGIVVGSTKGVDAAGVSAITYDELNDLIFSVNAAYRKNGEFMFNSNSLKTILSLKDGNSRPYFQPDANGAPPLTILGKKYVINDDMADLGASKKAILFGDMSAYHVRDVNDIILLRLQERYADYLQVGFLAFSRHDGKLMDAGQHPIKHILNPAS